MILHVLPGDAIVGVFSAANIDGDVAVCREALVDGDLSGDTLPEFWETRARVHGQTPDAERDYHEHVVREFAKLTALQSGSEINLWFEYELFCQVNMWFCLSLLADSPAEIFRVEPVILPEDALWDGFGNMTADDLKRCFEARLTMSQADLQLGAKLWSAYRAGDHAELERLSRTESPAFPKLREVCVAATERSTRPKQILADIKRDGETEFDKVFLEFKARAGEYGYGDTQVKKIWEELFV